MYENIVDNYAIDKHWFDKSEKFICRRLFTNEKEIYFYYSGGATIFNQLIKIDLIAASMDPGQTLLLQIETGTFHLQLLEFMTFIRST